MVRSPAVSLDFPPYGRWEMTQTRQKPYQRLPCTPPLSLFSRLIIIDAFFDFSMCDTYLLLTLAYQWYLSVNVNGILQSFSGVGISARNFFILFGFRAIATARVLLFGFWLSRSLLPCVRVCHRERCITVSAGDWYTGFVFALCKIGVQNRTYNSVSPFAFII